MTVNTRISRKALIIILLVGCLVMLTMAIGSIMLIRRPASDEIILSRAALGETTPALQVQELLDQSLREFEKYTTGSWKTAHEKALQLAEKALSRAEKLPTERERKIARMHALVVKTRYLGYSERREVEQLDEEALTLARELGDRLIEARILTRFAMSYRPPAGYRGIAGILKLLDEAASLYRSAGDQTREGRTLLMKAHILMKERGQYAEAKQIISQAKKLSIESEGRGLAASCDAAFELIEHVPQTQALRRSMDAWNWDCIVLKKEDNGLISYGGGFFGGGGGGALSVSPFHQTAIVTNEPLIDASKRPGDTWTKDTFSYGHHPLRTTVTVVSDGDTVTVPAGTFTGCLLIRMETRDTDKTKSEGGRIVRTNEALLGTREIWYAPGVGIVKLQVKREKERMWKDFTIALRAYTIQEETHDYLPLAIGNRWVYGREDLGGQKYISERVLQVRSRDEDEWDKYYLSHYNYIYKHKS